MNNASELRPTVGYDNTLTHTSLAMKEYFGEKKKNSFFHIHFTALS